MAIPENIGSLNDFLNEGLGSEVDYFELATQYRESIARSAGVSALMLHSMSPHEIRAAQIAEEAKQLDNIEERVA